MNKVDVFNETSHDIDEYLSLIKDLLEYTLKEEKVESSLCTVIFVTSKKIQELNKNYRNNDSVTDVISFALEDNLDIKMEIRVLGDIYICYDRAIEQANEYGHSEKREIAFLAVHGLLHLLGYDHMIKEDELEMFKRQEEVLTSYGITR